MTTGFENVSKAATIQVAGDARDGSKQSIPCTFNGMQGKRLMLETNRRLASSTTVSVEYNDAMFLGEVIACTPGNGDTWKVEVKVEQILTGLQSLMALRSRLLDDSVASPFGALLAGAAK